MATNHTTNYALNLWTPTDKFVREEFNENTSKIDAALKAEADARAALAQTVNTKADAAAVTAETNARTAAVNAINTTLSGMVKLTVGSYVGNGASSRTISTGFTPRAVFVFMQEGGTGIDGYFGGLAVTGKPVIGSSNVVAIQSGGFNVYNNGNVKTNESNRVFHYLALA